MFTVDVKQQYNNNNDNCKMVVLICCFILFINVVPFDYVSTQEFGSIVSDTLNIEKTHVQFSHELL